MLYKNFTIHHFKNVDSTNNVAWHLAKSFQIDHNHLILADSQTGGKGRMGKNWQSPSGNLYFSLLLKPQKSINKSSQLSFLAAVALGLTIDKFNNDKSIQKPIHHKWPNDILLDGKKIAGILLESDYANNQQLETTIVNFIVLGIGVNVNSHPTNTSFPASNLASEGLIFVNKNKILKSFLDDFANLYQQWLKFSFTPIRNLWLSKAYKIKEKITVNLPKQTLEGIFYDLDNEGNLLLEVDGRIILINSGEVFVNHF